MIARTTVRTALIFLCCALILAAAGFLAWVSQRPNDPLLVRAERWPGVGPLVIYLRQAYRPPETVRVGGGRDVPRVGEAPEAPGVALGLPPWEGMPGYVWVQDGMVLRTEPSHAAPEIQRYRAISNVARLERRGDWFRVWRQGVEGWVHMPGYVEEPEEPPWGEEPEAPAPLAPADADADLLADALAEMDGDRVLETSFGPYRAYVDFEDRRLFDLLSSVAAQVEPLWSRRHGLEPLGEPASVVVLYRRQASYRALERASDELRGLDAEGFAGYGLVATYWGAKSREEVAATVVHEICHRIHRRALGPALPPWLEEGLADDLALARIEDGRLDPSAYSGLRISTPTAEGARIRFTQGLAALWNLKEEILRGQMPLLVQLTDLDRDAFLDPSRGTDARRLRYDAVALWVRYLVSAEGGKHRDGWQRFLRGIADGGPVTADALLESVGVPADELEADFRTWVVRESRDFVGE